MERNNRNRSWIWVVAALMAVFHQDFWWWGDRTLVWGFLPIGLFYHALFSVVAAAVWAMACRWAWPVHIEEWADAVPGTGNVSTAKENS